MQYLGSVSKDDKYEELAIAVQVLQNIGRTGSFCIVVLQMMGEKWTKIQTTCAEPLF